MGFNWASLLTEADLYNMPASENRVLTEAVELKVTASVNVF